MHDLRPPRVPGDHTIISKRTWSSGTQQIRLTVDDAHRAVMVIAGKATVAGAELLMSMVDEMQAELGTEILVSVLGDMRAVRGVPFRAQAKLLNYFIQGRRQISKAAFILTSPFELGIGRTLLGLTGMGSRARLCRNVPDAVRFLEWPETRYQT